GHSRNRCGALTGAEGTAPPRTERNVSLSERRLKPAILALVILCSSATEALSGCPDLSGKYYRQGEDGYVIFRIRQVECSSLEISDERNYLGKITITKSARGSMIMTVT